MGLTGGQAMASSGSPDGIAVSVGGHVYVADSNNYRLEVFTPDGTYETTWGTGGNGDGHFIWPTGIAVGTNGKCICPGLRGNSRVQELAADGTYVTQAGQRTILSALWDYHGRKRRLCLCFRYQQQPHYEVRPGRDIPYPVGFGRVRGTDFSTGLKVSPLPEMETCTLSIATITGSRCSTGRDVPLPVGFVWYRRRPVQFPPVPGH